MIENGLDQIILGVAPVFIGQGRPTFPPGFPEIELERVECQRRQYGLMDHARELGFAEVTVIDDDLGGSGSGLTERPGFQRLVAEVCSGSVGAIFCIEASRLARNGRDWHHLIELCGMTGAVVIDPDGVYDPPSSTIVSYSA
jgi:DNA invertase Pin-like site-specific DNA recombinase